MARSVWIGFVLKCGKYFSCLACASSICVPCRPSPCCCRTPSRTMVQEKKNCTCIFCPDAAKGIMKPKTRSCVLRICYPIKKLNLVAKIWLGYIPTGTWVTHFCILILSQSTQAPTTWWLRYWPSWDLLDVTCLQKNVASWGCFEKNLEGFPLYPENTWTCWVQANVTKIAKAILATLSKESSLILPEARRNLVCTQNISHKLCYSFSKGPPWPCGCCEPFPCAGAKSSSEALPPMQRIEDLWSRLGNLTR